MDYSSATAVLNSHGKEFGMQGLGIAALVVSIIAIFTPFFGYALSGISGLMAIACFRHGSPYAMGALVLNLVNLFLLSPMFFIAVLGQLSTDSPLDPLFDKLDAPNVAAWFFWLVGIQIVGIVMFIRAKRKASNPTSVTERIEPTID